jgi:hypothetical protein
MFEIVQDYTIYVKMLDLFTTAPEPVAISGSPVYNVVVLESLVQAKYSDLLDESSPLEAGVTYQWKIQAKDVFGNVVAGTEDRFSFQIKDTLAETETLLEAEVVYEFSLYTVTFTLQTASDYSSIIRLTQQGGLVATYYETTNFQAPIEDIEMRSHAPSYSYTQIDAALDFDLGDLPMALASGRTYPSQYFSVKWEGHLRAPHSETFRLYLETHGTNQFDLKLAGQTIISNSFVTSNDEDLPTTSFFASTDVDLV